jgi:hypothetical protein
MSTPWNTGAGLSGRLPGACWTMREALMSASVMVGAGTTGV